MEFISIFSISPLAPNINMMSGSEVNSCSQKDDFEYMYNNVFEKARHFKSRNRIFPGTEGSLCAYETPSDIIYGSAISCL